MIKIHHVVYASIYGFGLCFAPMGASTWTICPFLISFLYRSRRKIGKVENCGKHKGMLHWNEDTDSHIRGLPKTYKEQEVNDVNNQDIYFKLSSNACMTLEDLRMSVIKQILWWQKRKDPHRQVSKLSLPYLSSWSSIWTTSATPAAVSFWMLSSAGRSNFLLLLTEPIFLGSWGSVTSSIASRSFTMDPLAARTIRSIPYIYIYVCVYTLQASAIRINCKSNVQESIWLSCKLLADA